AEILKDHKAYFHVDAAQGFGKDIDALRHPRIDLMSLSGHKIHAPMGIGALITRRRGRDRPPLSPRFFGGGQELGVRPGTLPAPLIACLGLAAELVVSEKELRRSACANYEEELLAGLAPLKPMINGDPNFRKASILNISFPGVDSESLMEAWSDLVAISNGAACTSQSYSCSHVLGAMGLEEERTLEAVRLSWCHLTPKADFPAMIRAFEELREDMGHG
ncbi:MAG: aminotransferase class V-fold PLP-dependent enzyme, partial [Planctomycetota bacterium]|nr:aminotransferase class V-fold PLP-dependent enzyme [Planctomycetota bacterium]